MMCGSDLLLLLGDSQGVVQIQPEETGAKKPILMVSDLASATPIRETIMSNTNASDNTFFIDDNLLLDFDYYYSPHFKKCNYI